MIACSWSPRSQRVPLTGQFDRIQRYCQHGSSRVDSHDATLKTVAMLKTLDMTTWMIIQGYRPLEVRTLRGRSNLADVLNRRNLLTVSCLRLG
ncbi:hypothetical protein BC830DRAFT_1142500 [Chytriomyces sp. MP71]|nr:hypothetical protein BC830DRAFT_1142500 [Chytriomyces sp. MP71]